MVTADEIGAVTALLVLVNNALTMWEGRKSKHHRRAEDKKQQELKESVEHLHRCVEGLKKENGE